MASTPSGQSQSMALACRVVGGWSPSPIDNNNEPTPKIAVQINDLVWVKLEKNGWSFIQAREKAGWVPSVKILKGRQQVKPMPIRFPKVTTPLAPGLNPNPHDNAIPRTLRMIWTTIKNNGNQIIRPADRNNQVIAQNLFGVGVDTYPDILYRAMNRNVIKFVQNGRFDPREVFAALPSVGSAHQSSEVFGIYVYFFVDVTHGAVGLVRDAKDGIYVGQTLDFQAREKQHNQCLDVGKVGKNSNLYQIGKTAKHRKMCPLFIFRHDDPEVVHYGKSRLLHIAELTAVCLFRSFYPILLQGEPSSPSLVPDYEYARLFTAVMDRVCKQVAWNPRPTLD